MKKTNLISILTMFIIIWNVIFPCISHAENLDTIDKIKYAFEQEIINAGEVKKQEALSERLQRPGCK